MAWGRVTPGTLRTSSAAWKKLRLEVLERDGGRCGICGGMGSDQVDHVVPVSRGGSDSPSNLRAVHRACHLRKTSAEGSAARAAKYRTKRLPEPHPGLLEG